MNLRESKGKIPVWVGGQSPYVLVDFPSKKDFFALYPKGISEDNISKYWEVLNVRKDGATLSDAGKPFGLTKERVRQIEAKFLRLMADSYVGEM